MKKVILAVVILFVIGGFIIVNQHDYDLSEKDGKVGFVKSFGSWVWQLGKSTKNTVGYAIHQNWLPSDGDNETNTTEGDTE